MKYVDKLHHEPCMSYRAQKSRQTFCRELILARHTAQNTKQPCEYALYRAHLSTCWTQTDTQNPLRKYIRIQLLISWPVYNY